MTVKSEDKIEVPELEIPVSKAWIRFIRWCQVSFPYGTVTIQIVNAQPTKLVDKKQDIRFDKETTIPVNFDD